MTHRRLWETATILAILLALALVILGGLLNAEELYRAAAPVAGVAIAAATLALANGGKR